MNKNKKLEEQCVILLKAINLLDKIGTQKVDQITNNLLDILTNETTKLSDRYGYMPSDIDKMLKKAGTWLAVD
jgi:hypothetical protein